MNDTQERLIALFSESLAWSVIRAQSSTWQTSIPEQSRAEVLTQFLTRAITDTIARFTLK